MGRKKLIKREDIILAGIQLIRNKGYKYISARNIAEILKCSTQPIYNRVENIEEIHHLLIEKAYHMMIEDYLFEETGEDPFLNLGLGMIKFAKNEHNLFEYLYLSKHSIKRPEDDNKPLIKKMKTGSQMHNLEDHISKKIHEKISIFTFGLSVKVMKNPKLYSEKEIRNLLIETARGISHWERRE